MIPFLLLLRCCAKFNGGSRIAHVIDRDCGRTAVSGRDWCCHLGQINCSDLVMKCSHGPVGKERSRILVRVK